jgi:hypothetical protein
VEIQLRYNWPPLRAIPKENTQSAKNVYFCLTKEEVQLYSHNWYLQTHNFRKRKAEQQWRGFLKLLNLLRYGRGDLEYKEHEAHEVHLKVKEKLELEEPKAIAFVQSRL